MSLSLKERIRIKIEERLFRAVVRSRHRNDLIRLGTTYGGFWVPAELLARNGVAYSAGVGEDVSFDESLVRDHGMQVWTLDPTPRSAAYMAGRTSEHLHFLPVGLWSDDVTQRFYAPKDPNHVSHSVLNLDGTDDGFDAECRSLSSLRAELGHSDVVLLKMNIEGAEGAVLDEMATTDFRPAILVVALEEPTVRQRVRRVHQVRGMGYEVVCTAGHTATFVRQTFSSPASI